jgi:hypothetical protein
LSDTIEKTIDFDNPRAKRDVLTEFGALTGLWTISGKRASPKMRDRARGYYFGVVCKSLMLYVAEQGQDMTKDQASAVFKEKFLLPQTFTNLVTGEEETIPPSITRLDTHEGWVFVQKCIVWLSEMGVYVPEPNFRISEPTPRRKSA